MIKTFYKDAIINCLAAVITYGLENNYSYPAIEERIAASDFVNKLENNDFDTDSNRKDVIKQVFGLDNLNDFDISFRGLFFAESYVRLFFDLNKSFEYLFLYWPLSHFVDTYDVYHEMDYSNFKNDFLSLASREPLLKKLSKSKNIKLSEVSRLTGINENSIKYYALKDSNLYGCSIVAIHALATLFKVKINIFLPNLGVYLDDSVYLFDESNKDFRNYLGFYSALYFDQSLKEKSFIYDDDRFVGLDCATDIRIISERSGNLKQAIIDECYKENDYLIIFINGFSSLDDFSFLNGAKPKEIAIITQDNVHFVKKNRKKEITDTINRSLIIRAKEKAKAFKNRL